MHIRSMTYVAISISSLIKNLTHLDVSENSIEKLDISALQELRSVRCARNILTELTVCGRNIVSLIAGNNSEAPSYSLTICA